jgi:hypothetical protein
LTLSSAKSTEEKATLRVTKGPDKGASFDVREEIVHVGRGEDNHLRLTDESLEEHELSIVFRNGRYAVYASREERVSVDGNLLPAEKWVWLPEHAKIELGRKNVLLFEYKPGNTAGETAAPRSEAGSPGDKPNAGKSAQVKSLPPPGKRAPQGRKMRETGRKSAGQSHVSVARFITDQVGDPLVKLGEDGHLPELSLEEATGGKKKKDDQKSKQGNPFLVYLAVGFSVISSTLMMVFDIGPGSNPRIDKSTAREEIRQFYGSGEDRLEDYQLLLRDAALAHSRSDFQREKAYYRHVLGMLRSEDNQGFIRLTKTPESDEKLRELLATLLAE